MDREAWNFCGGLEQGRSDSVLEFPEVDECFGVEIGEGGDRAVFEAGWIGVDLEGSIG